MNYQAKFTFEYYLNNSISFALSLKLIPIYKGWKWRRENWVFFGGRLWCVESWETYQFLDRKRNTHVIRMNACWGLVGVKHRHSLLWFLCEWGLALTIFSINFETTSTAKQLSIRLIIIHCAHKMNISIRTNSFYRPFHFRDIIWKKKRSNLMKIWLPLLDGFWDTKCDKQVLPIFDQSYQRNLSIFHSTKSK